MFDSCPDIQSSVTSYNLREKYIGCPTHLKMPMARCRPLGFPRERLLHYGLHPRCGRSCFFTQLRVLERYQPIRPPILHLQALLKASIPRSTVCSIHYYQKHRPEENENRCNHRRANGRRPNGVTRVEGYRLFKNNRPQGSSCDGMGENEGYPEEGGPGKGDPERVKETKATEAHGNTPNRKTACGD